MAPKNKRNRQRNQSGSGASTAAVEATNLAPSVASKREKRPKTAKSRRQARQDEQAKLIRFGAVAIGVLILAVVAWGVVQFSVGGAGSVTNFDFAVYQGRDDCGYGPLPRRNHPCPADGME